MTAPKKRAYTKRDKAHWANPSARRRKAIASSEVKTPEPSNNLVCNFCTQPARTRLAVLGRSKAFLLCPKDLKRLVNGKSML